MFKFTLRIILHTLIIPLTIIVYYIGFGHKVHSIFENYHEAIAYNLSEIYGVDIKYGDLKEEWEYLKPYLEISNLEIKDNNGNQFNTEKVSIRVDLMYLITEQKLKVKKANIDNSTLTINHNGSSVRSNDLSLFKKININKLDINNLNIFLNVDGANYTLNKVNLNYSDFNDFFIINNDKIKIKKMLNDTDYHNVEVEGDIMSIINIMIDYGFEDYIKESGYGSVFDVDGNIDIKLNFKNKEDFNLEFKIKNNKVNLLSEGLSFKDFNGFIYFNSLDNKLHSNLMKCKTNNKECTFEIKENKGKLFLNFSAYANKDTLSKYLYFINNDSFNGDTKITGNYNVDESLLRIKSDLKGIEIKDLPLLSKSKNEPLKMDLKLDLKDNKENLSLTVGDLQVFLDIIEKYTQIYINSPIKKYKKTNKNLVIEGEVNNLNIIDTIGFINSLNFGNDKETSDFTYSAELKLNNSNYLNIKPETVIYSDNNGIADINIIDPNINGIIKYDIKNNNLKATIDNFVYELDVGIETNDLNISELPNLDVEIKDFVADKYSGNLSFNGRHNNDLYIIDNINGLVNNIKPSFIVKIEKGEVVNTSLISINENKLFEFEDISKIFNSYGYKETITSKDGFVYGKVNWDGLIPNIKTLNGDLKFEINDGKINTNTAGTRAIKMFKLFEINMLNELFNLDFDFIKKGTRYNKISGNGSFVDGVYHINKNIEMKSSNYNAKINGKIDFTNEIFENRISIDLPVSQKLPTLALLSGNPIAIAGVWAADKLIGEHINKLTRIKFNIKGNFEDPKIVK